MEPFLTACLAYYDQKFLEALQIEDEEDSIYEQAYAMLTKHIITDLLNKLDHGIILTPVIKQSIKNGWFDQYIESYLTQDAHGQELLALFM